MHKTIVDTSEEVKVELGSLNTKFEILEQSNKAQVARMNNLKEETKSMVKNEAQQIITNL